MWTKYRDSVESLATWNNQWVSTSDACLLLVETVETPNDGGGEDSGVENQQVNVEAQEKFVLQDAEMEEGNLHSTWKKILTYSEYCKIIHR